MYVHPAKRGFHLCFCTCLMFLSSPFARAHICAPASVARAGNWPGWALSWEKVLHQSDLSCSHMNATFSRREETRLNRGYWKGAALYVICCCLLKQLHQISLKMLFSVGDILTALINVSGRKHPSTVQAKQLKMCLPMMPVVLHLMTSQVDLSSKNC